MERVTPNLISKHVDKLYQPKSMAVSSILGAALNYELSLLQAAKWLAETDGSEDEI
jgi:hypothetical protein